MSTVLRRFLTGGVSNGALVSSRRPSPVRLSFELLEDRALPSLVGTVAAVNTTTAGEQWNAATASSAGGKTVVVWEDWSGAPTRVLKARVYDPAAATPWGDEITVTGASADGPTPAVAMNAAGDFVVFDTVGHFAHYQADGTLLGAGAIPAQIGNYDVNWPNVTLAADGSFAVCYDLVSRLGRQGNIGATLFDAAGNVLKTFKVAATLANEFASDIAGRPDGHFSVLYSQGKHQLVLKRYDAAGKRLGTNTITLNALAYGEHDVAMDDSGNTWVAWNQFARRVSLLGGGFVNINNIHVREVTAAGARLAQIIVDPDKNADSVSLGVAGGGSGAFVVAYRSGATVNVTEASPTAGVYAFTGVFGVRDGHSAFDDGGVPQLSLAGDGYTVVFCSQTAGDYSDGDGFGMFTQFGHLS